MAVSITVLGFLLICVISAINNYLNYLKKYRDLNKLPGPSSFEIIRQLVGGSSTDDKFTFISTLHKKYGPVVKLWVKPFSPRIIVADLEYYNRILLSKTHLTKSNLYDLMKPVIGEGLGTTNNIVEWQKERKICHSAFQTSAVQEMLPVISKYTDILMKIVRNRAGEIIDTQPLLHLYTLDVMFETVTKREQTFLENDNSTYLEAYFTYFDIIAERIYSFLLLNNFLFRCSKYYENEQKSSNFLVNYTREIIVNQLANNEYNTAGKSRLHLIDVLLANNLTKDKINSHMNTFIIGGNDTTGQALCFILYQISIDPDAQSKILKEINSVVGEDRNIEISNHYLSKMKYIECFIKEVTRCFPIIPFIERKLSKDEIIAGISYPKDTTFLFHIDSVHKSENYFENPNKFDPDRFMAQNAHLQKNSFLTFSIGPRDCIGKLFAMLFMKYFVAKIIQNFVVKPVENHKLKLSHKLTMTSSTGVPVMFEERL